MADKNDSGGGGKRRALGLEIHCRRASQLRVSALLFLPERWRLTLDKLHFGTGV